MMKICKNLVHGTIITSTLKRYIVNLKQLHFHKWAAFWYLALHVNCAPKEYKATAGGKLGRRQDSCFG